MTDFPSPEQGNKIQLLGQAFKSFGGLYDRYFFRLSGNYYICTYSYCFLNDVHPNMIFS